MKVFLDCPDCDSSFFKSEITYVDFVRDRRLADVHVLIAHLPTAGGGRRYHIECIGEGRFDGMRDTLEIVTDQTDSEDGIRRKTVHAVSLGLVRFSARTSLAPELTVAYAAPTAPIVTADPWKHWIIQLSTSFWINGEKDYHSLSLSSNLSARRVTKMNKIKLSVWNEYSESKFDYGFVKTLKASRGNGGKSSFIHGVSEHWSTAVSGSLYDDSYSNKDADVCLTAAIEYSILPYSECTRRQLRLDYRFVLDYADYREETIYNKTVQWLQSNEYTVEVEFIQPWGSVSGWLSLSHDLHDFARNRVELYTDISLRLVRGLAFEGSILYSRIHDQLSLAKGDASPEDVLLRRRELETNYSFWITMGLSYSFGSIYSPIVNPRFGN
ncbi:MAG: hypothetical protein GYA46_05380 [candidate division Zixibacteria bacterium]|nr:hypothetical protein [candidate division Zixibacteria bacterium]